MAPLEAPLPTPEHLAGKGRTVWLTVMRERHASLTPAEVHMVERYCELQDRREMLMEHLSVHGWSVPGSRPGMLVMAPQATALQATEIEIRQMERVLGLGPAYRAKLAIDLLAVDEGIDRAVTRREAVAVSDGASDPRLTQTIDVDPIDDD